MITGHFDSSGFQDVLLYYRSGIYAGEGEILAGQGDGSALWPYGGDTCAIPSVGLTDVNGDNPLQVVNAYASISGASMPSINTPTPDGTADWNQWTLATLQDGSGTGMFLWKPSTGALYLWRNLTAHDNGDGSGALSYTQYLISPHWQMGAALFTLEAADLNGDGIPDLWAVFPDGTVRAYLISGLSTTRSAKIAPQQSQKLSRSA